jgi:hypothetical protein
MDGELRVSHKPLICNGYNVRLPYTRIALPPGRSMANQTNQTLGESGTAIAYEEVHTEFGEFHAVHPQSVAGVGDLCVRKCERSF